MYQARLKPGTLTAIAAGANHNVDLGKVRMGIIGTLGGVFNITGFQNGKDGEMLVLVNRSGQNMTLTDESASSTAENRIALNGATAATTANGSATLIYVGGTINRWVLIGISA